MVTAQAPLRIRDRRRPRRRLPRVRRRRLRPGPLLPPESEEAGLRESAFFRGARLLQRARRPPRRKAGQRLQNAALARPVLQERGPPVLGAPKARHVPRPRRNLLLREILYAASTDYPRRGRGATATFRGIPPRNHTSTSQDADFGLRPVQGSGPQGAAPPRGGPAPLPPGSWVRGDPRAIRRSGDNAGQPRDRREEGAVSMCAFLMCR